MKMTNRIMAYYDKDSKPWAIDAIPAFCINLERRLDRWQEFTSQPGVEALPKLKRFLATDGKTLDVRSDSRIPLLTKRNILVGQRRSHEDIDTMGAIGCALSHIGIWEKMVAENMPLCLVMEDDAVVPFDFVRQINYRIEQSPVLQDLTKWELFILCHQLGGLEVRADDPTLQDVGAFMGTQCYVITLACAKRFLQEAYTLHMQIDLWMGVYKSVHGLQIICPTNYVVKQRLSKTDIQNTNKCHVCDLKSNFAVTHSLIRHEELWLIRGLEVGSVLAAAYLAYRLVRS